MEGLSFFGIQFSTTGFGVVNISSLFRTRLSLLKIEYFIVRSHSSSLQCFLVCAAQFVSEGVALPKMISTIVPNILSAQSFPFVATFACLTVLSYDRRV